MPKELLANAQKNKQDEFYTMLSDIEQEMKHYRAHFKGKVVFCNCDDPYESNFFKYFAMNFNYLGLKKLIATCYVSSPIMYTQLALFDDMEFSYANPRQPNKKPYKVEITEVADENGDGAFDLDDIKHLLKNKKNVCSVLKGDGDFRSEECLELLKEADIVVTNPPFSLFREYIQTLVQYKKRFIIIGNQNAIGYKEVFPLISENKVWLGASIHSGDREFRIPDHYEVRSKSLRIDDKGNRYIRVVGVRWFTNLEYEERHEDLVLFKKYSPEEYPEIDNFEGINVSSTADIPCDYYGVMGVPITFLDKYNPDQFEIVGITQSWTGAAKKIYPKQVQINKDGKQSLVTKLNDGPAIEISGPLNGKTYYIVDGKYYQKLFARILIRRKEQPT
ncbi:MAG: adenine-specific methyltransferase EcoRI family protein [Clostridiales bacterium]|nr:adenine-specific methyltransferase EcoRI family protein [Clostridiales bacterium]